MAARRTLDVAGPDDGCDTPHHRMCAVARAPKPLEQLLRFAEGPDGAMVPDLRNRLPGRGVWITAARSAVAQAVHTKAFQRSLKHPVAADAALPDLVDRLMEAAALSALSFVNKAGALVLGFDQVEALSDKGKAFAVVHASDASPDGVRKLKPAPRDDAAGPKIVVCFSNEQLSLALGRPNVVHAGLLAAPVSSNFIEQTERLLRYRSS